MSDFSHKKWLRVLVGVGVPFSLLALVVICIWLNATPPCWFYELTGLYCAGCGSGRAFLAILRADFYAAFRFQPLMIIFLPFLCYYCLKQYIAFVFGRDILPFPKIRSRFWGIFLLVLIISYWVLRNIPIFPFDLLAPTAV